MFWKESHRSSFFHPFNLTLLIFILLFCDLTSCHRKIYEIKISELSSNSPNNQPPINKEQLLSLISGNFDGFLSLQTLLI